MFALQLSLEFVDRNSDKGTAFWLLVFAVVDLGDFCQNAKTKEMYNNKRNAFVKFLKKK